MRAIASLKAPQVRKKWGDCRTAAPIERTDYVAMLDVLDENREEVVKVLDLSRASVLSEIVSRYLASIKQ